MHPKYHPLESYLGLTHSYLAQPQILTKSYTNSREQNTNMNSKRPWEGYDNVTHLSKKFKLSAPENPSEVLSNQLDEKSRVTFENLPYRAAPDLGNREVNIMQEKMHTFSPFINPSILLELKEVQNILHAQDLMAKWEIQNKSSGLFLVAASLGKSELIDWLLGSYCGYSFDEVTTPTLHGLTALNIATQYGHIKIIEKLLESKYSNHFILQCQSGMNPLHSAAIFYQHPAAQFILSYHPEFAEMKKQIYFLDKSKNLITLEMFLAPYKLALAISRFDLEEVKNCFETNIGLFSEKSTTTLLENILMKKDVGELHSSMDEIRQILNFLWQMFPSKNPVYNLIYKILDAKNLLKDLAIPSSRPVTEDFTNIVLHGNPGRSDFDISENERSTKIIQTPQLFKVLMTDNFAANKAQQMQNVEKKKPTRRKVSAANKTSVNSTQKSQPSKLSADNVEAHKSEDLKKAEIYKSRYWTNIELELFLKAIELFSIKNVKDISKYVGTRTPTQVRTHAQKWFAKPENVAQKAFYELQPHLRNMKKQPIHNREITWTAGPLQTQQQIIQQQVQINLYNVNNAHFG